MPETEGNSIVGSGKVERDWKEVEAERDMRADMDPFETEDDTVEDEYFDLEQELHYKSDRRKTKKETMPLDGQGLIKIGLNRKYKQQRRQQKENE